MSSSDYTFRVMNFDNQKDFSEFSPISARKYAGSVNMNQTSMRILTQLDGLSYFHDTRLAEEKFEEMLKADWRIESASSRVCRGGFQRLLGLRFHLFYRMQHIIRLISGGMQIGTEAAIYLRFGDMDGLASFSPVPNSL